MIGSPIKLKAAADAKDLKEITSFRLTGSLIEKLNAEMLERNISKSEIAEFALRKLFGLNTDNCRNVLNHIYKAVIPEN